MTKDTTATEWRLTVALGACVGFWFLLTPDAAGVANEDRYAVSPALKIAPTTKRKTKDYMRARAQSVRSIDGRGNNPHDPAMGAALTTLLRRVPPDYADGISEMAGSDRPSPRAISVAVSAQTGLMPNRQGLGDFFWQWGQFLDRDLDLVDGVSPPEPAPIEVPAGDPFFDPDATGTAEIAFNRSNYHKETGKNPEKPREQLNELTAWIDASNVYGSDPTRAAALRTNDGTGRLRTSAGDLLPFNTNGLPNGGGVDPSLFLAGDVRVNEQVGLIAMHTLFMREHNRLAGLIAAADPGASGDEIYERARRIVGAQMQVITYNEFLPVLLGRNALKRYRGYDPGVDARIANAFAAAAYRFGHSALSPVLQRLDAAGNEIEAGHLPLRDAFFTPWRIIEEGGIEPLLRGLARQVCQRVDPYVVDEVRNFLFGPPGAGGFDLPALNLQRGRDHGLPTYNDTREAMGLRRAKSFADVSSDREVQARLSAIYPDSDSIDLWIGGLAETPRRDAQVGELFFTIIKEQFEALRDGDRFWYELILSKAELREVEETRLSDIIRRNTEIDDEIPDDVFRARRIRGRSQRAAEAAGP
jgi:peroxidase